MYVLYYVCTIVLCMYNFMQNNSTYYPMYSPKTLVSVPPRTRERQLVHVTQSRHIYNTLATLQRQSVRTSQSANIPNAHALPEIQLVHPPQSTDVRYAPAATHVQLMHTSKSTDISDTSTVRNFQLSVCTPPRALTSVIPLF
jgi:hypothetical protein